MADLSKYCFTGRLGADAVVKTTPNGKSIMEMSVAINTGYGDYKKTLWVKVKQFGDRVKNIAPIFTKGALIAGCGELDVDEWTKDNEKHYAIVIKCMDVQILSSKKNDGATEPDIEPTDEEPVF
ncbi:MAG: single-stranded DNA-binding protein [Pseudobutyrivibrio sp.]|nr:single-stranded DNA-binding protein [Pseudobutyrivibrio sp.]